MWPFKQRSIKDEIVELLKCNELGALQISKELRLWSPPYVALTELEKEGLIERRMGDRRSADRGYARSAYYRLTQSGIKQLRQHNQGASAEGWQQS